MKRIVKEIKKDGSIQYRVESNKRFFGLFNSKKWHTCTITCYSNYGELVLEAVFDSIEEAEIFCGLSTNPVVKSEVIKLI